MAGDDAAIAGGGGRGLAPDIIADVDHHGAKLIIVDGEVRIEARPTPQGALMLGRWLVRWGVGAGADPAEDAP